MLFSSDDRRERSQSFNAVAARYDRYRPGYLVQLIDDILSITSTPKGGNILAVGSGTGIASLPFAQRGCSLLCIEPGENMVAVARQKLKSFPKVEFVVTAFEDWTEPESEFDLVISAQAFHWVSKETGYAKAARVLKPGGNIALFWNTPMDLEGELFEALNKVYQAYVPEMSKRHRHSYKQATQLQVKEITEDGYFGGVEIRSYPWSARYTTEEYIGLLGTHSDHLRLPEDQRNQLFEGVTQVLHQHGGFIERPYEAVAFIAGKIH